MVEQRKTVHQRSGARAQEQRHTWLWFVCGCGLALLFMELVLHNFSGKYEDSAGFELRRSREGVATSHFTHDGLRLTGNPRIPEAPNVLIEGDSHVEAFQVEDQLTMGAVLERRLRAEGKRWNVLQYGWGGADGPDYVYAAPLILERFHPRVIFLVMNAGDFASTTTESARLVEQNGEVVAEAVGPSSVRGRTPSYGGPLARKLKESGLLYAMVLRFTLDIRPQLGEHKASAQDGELLASTPASDNATKVIVRGLKQAYGSKLYILYTPSQPFSAETPVEPQEAALLSECRAKGVECSSLRERMVDDLLVGHELARGFYNSAPGQGHLNARGHKLVADQIYDRLNSSR
jgi:hypothetical protein